MPCIAKGYKGDCTKHEKQTKQNEKESDTYDNTILIIKTISQILNIRTNLIFIKLQS